MSDNHVKSIVDILSSLASIVAIVTVLYAWWNNNRPGVRIKSLIIHRLENQTRLYLRLANERAYPITIENFTCYEKLTYQTTILESGSPSTWPTLHQELKFYTHTTKTELTEMGEVSLPIIIDKDLRHLKYVYFSFNTSHGTIAFKFSKIKFFTGYAVITSPPIETESFLLSKLIHLRILVIFNLKARLTKVKNLFANSSA